MTNQSILEFWKTHQQFWISGAKEAEADALIANLYFPQFVDELPWLDAVIYCDQFMRHFSRVAATGITENDVVMARRHAVSLVNSLQRDELLTLPEDELMFALMAWKHAGHYEPIFATLHSWLPKGRSFTEFPKIHRFYKDTYTKMFDGWPIICTSNIGPWDPAICEACPPLASWGTVSAVDAIPVTGQAMMEALRSVAEGGKLWVSLSGGVDSNLMIALGCRAGLDVHAVHIVYGNRDTAEQEASFVVDLCAALGATCHMYRIPWIRRAQVDRAFYESMTRRIRFGVYNAVGAKEGVCLGHIEEDVVENIWTNFAHGAHLTNLAKMGPVEEEDGVWVLRPWLGFKKADIYAVASALNVPHLKNTTPAWSNRGKFRDTFYAATHSQYGADVDAKVLEVAAALKKQSEMLDCLLYEPVFASWTEDGVVDATPVFAAGGLDEHGWLRLLTYFCHTRLGIAKPSIHACRDLAERCRRPFTSMRIPVKKDLTLEFARCIDAVRLKFITSVRGSQKALP